MGTGFLLGLVTFVGIIFIYFRLPRVVQNLLIRAHLLTDLGLMIGMFLIMTGVSGSIAALFSTAILGVLMSASISWARYNRGYAK